jgi:hypothetical protein
MEINLAVHAENIKCGFVSPKQHAGQKRDTNLGNKTFEMVEQFNFWEKT